MDFKVLRIVTKLLTHMIPINRFSGFPKQWGIILPILYGAENIYL